MHHAAPATVPCAGHRRIIPAISPVYSHAQAAVLHRRTAGEHGVGMNGIVEED